ncbi:MAG: 50S ribosomal protein L11 methyltransferase [Bacteroidota bacterium]
MAGIDYLAIHINCQEELRDILIAELSAMEYDSMMETDDGLEAYVDKALFKEIELLQLIEKYNRYTLTYKVQEVVSRNWNEEWEKNYDPISVDDKIYVRATFHDPKPQFPLEIVINPRMSFGTGHHSTTYLMLKNQLDIVHQDKRVLDAGTGTGILAIMAEKLGASEVIAYDNNSWSIENAPENLNLNNTSVVTIQEGTIDSIQLEGKFDIILANINKNVLLEEMSDYIHFLSADGVLVLSGFYESDASDILSRAHELHMRLESRLVKNEWCSIMFTKET